MIEVMISDDRGDDFQKVSSYMIARAVATYEAVDGPRTHKQLNLWLTGKIAAHI